MKGSDQFKAIIQNHLNNIAQNDELFAKTLSKENKNIDECITYILNQVQASGQNGFADEEIYQMATHYYDEDDIKVGNKISARVVVNYTDFEGKKVAKQQKEKAPEPKKENKKTSKAKVIKMKANHQVSLFDFPGV